MGSQQVIEVQRQGAEVFQGNSVCKAKVQEFLKEKQLPKGVLPLDGIEEVGYNGTTKFVWLKQNREKEHKFEAIDRLVRYDSVVTAFVEKRRIRELTGVESKEGPFWVSVSDIRVDDNDLEKITFSSSGPIVITKTFPVSAFL